MIPYHIYDNFKLGPLTFHTWGIFVSLGFVAALIYILKVAKKEGLNTDKIFDLSLILLFSGIIGGRVGYVIANFQFFKYDLAEIIKVWDGGLGFMSGFLLATLAGYLYLKTQKISFWQVADIFAPAIAIGYFISRIGCFLVHDHLGKETKFFLSVNFNGKNYHETTIYTALSALTIFIILLILKRRPHQEGFLFIIFGLWYSVVRFIIEFFQAGPYFAKLTGTAWLSIATFILFLVLYFFYLKKTKKLS